VSVADLQAGSSFDVIVGRQKNHNKFVAFCCAPVLAVSHLATIRAGIGVKPQQRIG
jgi:hypothetical protein